MGEEGLGRDCTSWTKGEQCRKLLVQALHQPAGLHLVSFCLCPPTFLCAEPEITDEPKKNGVTLSSDPSNERVDTKERLSSVLHFLPFQATKGEKSNNSEFHFSLRSLDLPWAIYKQLWLDDSLPVKESGENPASTAQSASHF